MLVKIKYQPGSIEKPLAKRPVLAQSFIGFYETEIAFKYKGTLLPGPL